MALAFPDVYEVGMSHLGLKILYYILNSIPWLAAERAFCPGLDLERELRERHIPLMSLESRRPLNAFDILGFSLQNELCYTNVLTMLELSGIPFLSADRAASSNLVIAGGPACFNPEPIAEVFDVIVIGDGEEVVPELCRRVKEEKNRGGGDKERLLSTLAELPGVYVPSFYEVRYHADGRVREIHPTRRGVGRVRKALVSDLNRTPFPTTQVVPFTSLVHDRLAVEIARGCTRGCRFCQAGMIYRPVRERDPDNIIGNAQEALEATGFEELSLLSLSSGDYCAIGPLLKVLMDRQADSKVAVSFPSLRVDSIDPEWFDEIKRVRKTGFTLAPEAGNDRMRRIINKGLTNQDILKAVRAVYRAGWRLIKLYFMIGLPGEEEEDVADIVRLSKEVLAAAQGKGRKANLNISVALFVPKAHTPFMWAAQIDLVEGMRRIEMVRNAFHNNRRVRVKWNQPEMSWLEGVFSRGDRRLTKAVIRAWRMGARYDAWGEHYKKGLWEDAFDREDVDPSFYLYRQRTMDETFPWSHIDSGVRVSFLQREHEKSLREQGTPDCRTKCLECGVCDHKTVDPVLFPDWRPPVPADSPAEVPMRPGPRTLRMTFTKTGNAKYLSHLELVRLFIRAFNRAKVPMVYSKGFHPMPKVSFSSALPVGTESAHETVDIRCFDPATCPSLESRIGKQLPEGVRLLSIQDITGTRRPGRVIESHYRISLNGLKIDEEILRQFMMADHFAVTKQGPKGTRTVDARALVKHIGMPAPGRLEMILAQGGGPGLKPRDILAALFGLEDERLGCINILKTKQVMG